MVLTPFPLKGRGRDVVTEIVEQIGTGQTSFDEKCALFEIALGVHHDYDWLNKKGHGLGRPADYGYCVELGTFEGQSTVVLARALQDSNTECKPLFAVDPYIHSGTKIFDHDPFNQARRNFDKTGTREDICQYICRDRDFFRFCTLPFRFIFHDASHTYPNISESLNTMMAYLMADGWMALHDYNGEGVSGAVNNWLREQQRYNIEAFLCDNLACLHKKGD